MTAPAAAGQKPLRLLVIEAFAGTHPVGRILQAIHTVSPDGNLRVTGYVSIELSATEATKAPSREQLGLGEHHYLNCRGAPGGDVGDACVQRRVVDFVQQQVKDNHADAVVVVGGPPCTEYSCARPQDSSITEEAAAEVGYLKAVAAHAKAQQEYDDAVKRYMEQPETSHDAALGASRALADATDKEAMALTGWELARNAADRAATSNYADTLQADATVKRFIHLYKRIEAVSNRYKVRCYMIMENPYSTAERSLWNRPFMKKTHLIELPDAPRADEIRHDRPEEAWLYCRFNNWCMYDSINHSQKPTIIFTNLRNIPSLKCNHHGQDPHGVTANGQRSSTVRAEWPLEFVKEALLAVVERGLQLQAEAVLGGREVEDMNPGLLQQAREILDASVAEAAATANPTGTRLKELLLWLRYQPNQSDSTNWDTQAEDAVSGISRIGRTYKQQTLRNLAGFSLEQVPAGLTRLLGSTEQQVKEDAARVVELLAKSSAAHSGALLESEPDLVGPLVACLKPTHRTDTVKNAVAALTALVSDNVQAQSAVVGTQELVANLQQLLSKNDWNKATAAASLIHSLAAGNQGVFGDSRDGLVSVLEQLVERAEQQGAHRDLTARRNAADAAKKALGGLSGQGPAGAPRPAAPAAPRAPAPAAPAAPRAPAPAAAAVPRVPAPAATAAPRAAAPAVPAVPRAPSPAVPRAPAVPAAPSAAAPVPAAPAAPTTTTPQGRPGNSGTGYTAPQVTPDYGVQGRIPPHEDPHGLVGKKVSIQQDDSTVEGMVVNYDPNNNLHYVTVDLNTPEQAGDDVPRPVALAEYPPNAYKNLGLHPEYVPPGSAPAAAASVSMRPEARARSDNGTGGSGNPTPGKKQRT